MKSGEEYQVLGVRFAKSKDGVDTGTIYLATPFEEWEIAGSDHVDGVKVSSEWSRDADLVKKFHSLKINDVVSFSYHKGFQGKAVLSGVTVVKSAGAK